MLAAGGAFLLLRKTEEANVHIGFQGPVEVLVGVPFELIVATANRSSEILGDAALSLSLPEGMVFVGSPSQKYFERKDLGTLGAGGVSSERFTLMAVGEGQSMRRLEARVTYALSGATFEKNVFYDVAVGKSALSLDIRAPEKALAGQEFEVGIGYENQGQEDFSELVLRLEPLASFALKRAAPAPDEETTWRLGNLRAGSRGEVTVGATLVGGDGAINELRVSIEAAFGKERYRIAENRATVTIAASPVRLEISSGVTGGAARLNETLGYAITYENAAEVGLRDVVLIAALRGEVFDFSTLQTRAAFKSTDNTLVWNAANTPELALVAPGARGEVRFTVRSKAAYPVRRFGDRDFTLAVDAEFSSPTVPPLLAAEKTVAVARDEQKVAGAVAVEAVALFRDAVSGIVNAGPWPLRVNQPTQFSVHWKIRAYAAEMNAIEARASLGGNVRFVRVVRSDVLTVPEYNERTQELVWKIERIAANRGVLDAPVEAIFQVELTPSSLMVGSTALLMGKTAVIAADGFSGMALSAEDQELTTALPDDPTVRSGEGVVRP